MVKRLSIAGVLALLLILGTVYAQQEVNFLGRYDDVKYIKQDRTDTNQFVFARLIYNGRILGYYKNWYTDYPKGDEQLIMGLKRLTNLNIADHERAIPLNDPDLFKYPFLYSSEVGQLVFTADDARVMREYLDRGGFWMVDDFWGSFEWNNFVQQMRKVYPEVEIKDIPRDHPIFHIFYDIDKVIQVPSLAYTMNGGITYEQDGFQAECKGIWDEQGRLVMAIHHNTDLGDAYEWADEPRYPNYFSSYSYRIALNTFLYALSH
jgi:hypothetical protein